MVANEYATLAELKTRLRITDTADDVELQDKLTTASRDVEKATGGRQFWLAASTTARVYNPRGRVTSSDQGESFRVDDIGDVTGLVVEVGSDTAGWTVVTGYETLPDNAITRGRPVERLLRPGLTWATGSPAYLQRVRVTARWGWPAVPGEIHEATLLRAARLFRRKDSPEGVKGFSDLGVVRVSRYDADYAQLIRRFTRKAMG